MSISTIFNNDFFTIQKVDSISYSILFNRDYLFFIEPMLTFFNIQYSLANVDDAQNDEHYIKLLFTCDSVQTFDQLFRKKDSRLQYTDVQNLIIHLGNQGNIMESENYIMSFFDEKDIIVFDDNKFLYLGKNFHFINDDDSITIDYPIHNFAFLSPELISISTLPTNISSSSWLFSLGLLAIYAISGNNDINGKDFNFYKNCIENIQDTKLYFCILRCIHTNIKLRKFLFI